MSLNTVLEDLIAKSSDTSSALSAGTQSAPDAQTTRDSGGVHGVEGAQSTGRAQGGGGTQDSGEARGAEGAGRPQGSGGVYSAEGAQTTWRGPSGEGAQDTGGAVDQNSFRKPIVIGKRQIVVIVDARYDSPRYA